MNRTRVPSSKSPTDPKFRSVGVWVTSTSSKTERPESEFLSRDKRTRTGHLWPGRRYHVENDPRMSVSSRWEYRDEWEPYVSPLPSNSTVVRWNRCVSNRFLSLVKRPGLRDYVPRKGKYPVKLDFLKVFDWFLPYGKWKEKGSRPLKMSTRCVGKTRSSTGYRKGHPFSLRIHGTTTESEGKNCRRVENRRHWTRRDLEDK